MKKLIWKIKRWFKVFFELVKMFDSAFSEIRFINHKIVEIEKELEEINSAFDKLLITADRVVFSRNFRFAKYGEEVSKKYKRLEHYPIEEVLVALFDYLDIKPNVIVEKTKDEIINEELRLIFEKDKNGKTKRRKTGKSGQRRQSV